ncbi:Response regulator receiver domain-containing protein [Shimia gijangensis]|uniref:Response regulator receiver domain-containing protein n=1 Tax=Shimia gijangensis TaxID=1470563 RepID=A0A1M6Q7E6_9RHOB|nr:response regulator [Shimia gijangensis]SHK16224.1 Response regulator receiver domain-containing protein [Shimia gijangensis]
MDDFSLLTAHTQPTARRPLLGLTVLVVEDSRYACDAIRLLCLRSGARIRRADCLGSARKHLQTYRPSVVIVDMGLPDGSGADLIAELALAQPRVGVVLAISGETAVEADAMDAGADGFLPKPLASLGVFQEAILSRLPADRQPEGPRSVPAEVVHPDRVAYRDDLCHAAASLSKGVKAREIAYVGQFLSGIARSAGDRPLARAAEAISGKNGFSNSLHTDVSTLDRLLKDRIAQEVAI